MEQEEYIKKVLPLRNKIFRLALRLLNNREEAEDLLQDVLMKLWSKKTELEKYQKLESFVMAISKNLALDRLKKKGRNTIDLQEFHSVDKNTSPIQQLELKNTTNIIHKTINNLPEQQKTIIQLRDIEEYEFDEIAEITGMNKNLIRVNLSRARKKIRESLEKLESDEK